MSTCTPAFFVDASDRKDVQNATGDFPARLLIIDSHPASMLDFFSQVFSADAHQVEAVRTAGAAMLSIAHDPPDVILLDPHLPDRCGLELHREIQQIAPLIPVIFISAPQTSDAAIEAMKQGAYDYLFKPLEVRQLQRLVADALQLAIKMRTCVAGAAATRMPEVDDTLCGNSRAMREVYKSIALVAGQDVNVLITGESGTGKELVARAIHHHGARSDRPFLAINCAAIPENLLESELFGHEKGAFSGADRRRIGKFEQYSGGTILLDEIGDMPPMLQAKILRLIQEQTFERIGGNETIRTNVRLIASTHRDLKTRSAEGEFRADLYYRLSVFTIRIPPLRDRGEDLPLLIRHLLRRYSRELGRECQEITQDAMEQLQQYPWPGNIRELQSVLKQALLRSTGPVLLSTFLPVLTDTTTQRPSVQSSSCRDFDIDAFLRQRLTPDACDLYAEILREMDRHSLARVLTYTRGNQHMASRVLGIARQTLRSKLRECGLPTKQSARPALGLPCLPSRSS